LLRPQLFIYLYTVGLLTKIKLQGGMTAIAAEAFGQTRINMVV